MFLPDKVTPLAREASSDANFQRNVSREALTQVSDLQRDHSFHLCGDFFVLVDHSIGILHSHVYTDTGIIALSGFLGGDHGPHVVEDLFELQDLFRSRGDYKLIQIYGRPKRGVV